MGSTTITTVPGTLPFDFSTVLIEVKSDWSASWVTDANLIMLTGKIAVSEAGIDHINFYSRYGTVMIPGTNSYSTVAPLAYQNYWVRCSFPDDAGDFVIFFQGKFYNDGREPRGNATVTAGIQDWVAYGGKAVARRIENNTSFWYEDGDKVEIGWIPPMNVRDPKTKLLVGNRTSTTVDDGFYLHGGQSTWSHGDYLYYYINNYVNISGAPQFTLAGQWSVLGDISTSIDWGAKQSFEEVLRKLIPKQECGLDFVYVPTSAGYDVFIFTLQDADITFDSVTIPANANTVTIDLGSQLDLISKSIVVDRSRACDSIRVQSSRIVVCHSLAGASAVGSIPTWADLVARWTSTVESAWLDGDGLVSGGSTDAVAIENARKREKFKSVYRDFGAPDLWDMRGGDLVPAFDLTSSIVSGNSDFQTSVRHTLPWIPLFDNTDYTVNPPVETDDESDIPPEPKTPIAYLYVTGDDDADDLPPADQYVEAHQFGFHVSPLKHDWGVRVGSHNQIRLALTHLTDAQIAAFEDDPGFDWQEMIVTIAREMDVRLEFGIDIDPLLAAGDGSQRILNVPDAELWLLAPNTAVGLDNAGNVLYSPNEWVVLRNDVDRLALYAAGQKARYLDDRVRAEFTFKGWRNWVDLLGQLLIGVEESLSFTSVGTPVTSFDFDTGNTKALHLDGPPPIPSPQMTIKAGYAS